MVCYEHNLKVLYICTYGIPLISGATFNSPFYILCGVWQYSARVTSRRSKIINAFPVYETSDPFEIQ
jgi:hypothetical protein